MSELIRLYQLPAPEFAVEAPRFKRSDAASEADFTNFVGNIFASIGVTDYLKYRAGLHDLNGKIHLLNFLLNDVNSQLTNPYYPDEKIVAPKTGHVCLEGPFPDEKIRRCLFFGP